MISLWAVHDTFQYNPPTEPFLVIVYEDRDIIIVNKPSGILSVPGRVHHDSILTRLKERYPQVYDVHRLDMDTSGVMIFAKRRKSERALKASFRERLIKKRYIALLSNSPLEKEAFIDKPLLRIGGLPPISRVDPQGKSAQTSYRVIREEKLGTLVELIPHTGRSHQLRVHMLSIGCPIVGDRVYNQGSSNKRLMLHAKEISFPHPYSQEEKYFSIDPPFCIDVDRKPKRT